VVSESPVEWAKCLVILPTIGGTKWWATKSGVLKLAEGMLPTLHFETTSPSMLVMPVGIWAIRTVATAFFPARTGRRGIGRGRFNEGKDNFSGLAGAWHDSSVS